MTEAPSTRLHVLFVCIGNSCRSQMAEAFARAYGRDVLVAASAGLAPALAHHSASECNFEIILSWHSRPSRQIRECNLRF